jgi:hypothetical protein
VSTTGPVVSVSGASNTVLHADLTGKAEVPGPGDPDGRGSATITLDPGARQVCFELTASQIDTPTAAHIHIGPSDSAGEIKVTLDPPVNGSSKGCKDADASLIGQIAANADGFYVNVHTPPFPNGAIRGQLAR